MESEIWEDPTCECCGEDLVIAGPWVGDDSLVCVNEDCPEFNKGGKFLSE